MSEIDASVVATTRSTPLPFVLPLLKVNATTGEFYAAAALEVPDDAREMCDYASSKAHFQRLEKRCLEESGGRKVAPLRQMHTLALGAAGKVTAFEYADDLRKVTCSGIITDPVALAKALDGTYCGISMGGKKAYLGYDTAHPGVRRYTAMPNEISLVDLGAIPGTALTMLNAAGACEVVEADGTIRLLEKITKREDVTPASGEAAYGDVAYADETNKKYPLDTTGHIRAAWNYIHKGKNAGKYSAKDARTIIRKIVSAWKKKIDKAGPPSAATDEMGKGAYASAVLAAHDADPALVKHWGFNIASQVVNFVGELAYLAECQKTEEAKEGDTASEALCAQLDAAITALGNVALAMVAEELGELPAHAGDTDEPDEDVAAMAQATQGPPGTEPLQACMQKLHNSTVEMGAACAPDLTKGAGVVPQEDVMDEATLNKAVGDGIATALGLQDGRLVEDGSLAKAIGAAVTASLGLGTEDGPLAKAIGSAVTPKLDEMQKATDAKLAKIDERLAVIEKQEIPTPGVLLSLSKGADTDKQLDELAKSDIVAAVKLAQAQGGRRLTLNGFEAIPSA